MSQPLYIMSQDEPEDLDYIPSKRKKLHAVQKCDIHVTSDSANVLTPNSFDSWLTLLNAAKVRNCTRVLEQANTVAEGQIPLIYYHRQCRAVFTNKSKLEAIQKKESKRDEKANEESQTRMSARVQKEEFSVLLPVKCIFCDSVNKYIKGKLDNLTKCCENRSKKSIQDAAEVKQDFKIMGLMNAHDLIAAEAHYHRTCYKVFTRPPVCVTGDLEDKKQEPQDTQDQVFIELRCYLDQGILTNGNILTLSSVTTKYYTILKQQNLTLESQVKNLRRKIEHMYGENIKFVHAGHKKVLVFSASLKVEDLVVTISRLKDELQKCEVTINDFMQTAATTIRNEILAMDTSNDHWPPLPDTLRLDNSKIPKKTEYFLHSLLNGKTYAQPSSRVRRLMWSFSQVTTEAATLVNELNSSQEEADTRLLLHAKHAVESGFPSIIINCDDTDVAVLLLYHIPSLSYEGEHIQIILKSGSNNNQKYVDMTNLHEKLGDIVCNGLLAMHALTGCDSVSAFSGKGKAAAVKLVMKSASAVASISQLGHNFDLSTDVQRGSEKFVCQLYGGKHISDVNSLRYSIFFSRKGHIDSQNLPPCQHTLMKHILRANYQAGIWVRALECNPNIPPPELHGWKNDGHSIEIDWMSCEPAPTAVLELISCACSRQCNATSCSCIINGLLCTDMCKIKTCGNFKENDSENDDDDDDIDVEPIDSSDSENDDTE